ncbi:DUF2628 domain-containing protein [Pseudomonas sp. S31]|uniref:DUF2628 domain-containing protein n=1 Tax=Pseudomonas sp. S31 TaxID=1564473 RepID=UPI001914557B|nr:DUF2628 domain-containing protein [Pseudomonas sp. S31]MBK4998348.1 DUF2628 domain-containing protein [Pseudomonas sp. S31]
MRINQPVMTLDVSPKWRERFAFFEQHGGPKSPGFQAAFKALPKRKRILININIIAMFFGVIYFFVLGLWRKNLTLIAISVGVTIGADVVFQVIGQEMPNWFGNSLSVAFGLMYGLTANYAYYLHKVKGSQSWNPFEGIRWI